MPSFLTPDHRTLFLENYQARPWPVEAQQAVETALMEASGVPSPTRLWQGTVKREGRQVTMVRMEGYVYAAERGQLWVFCLEETPTAPVPEEVLWRAYLAHRKDPSDRAVPAPWPLVVNDRFSLPTDLFEQLPGWFTPTNPTTFPAWLGQTPVLLERLLAWAREDLAQLQSQAQLKDEDVVMPPFLAHRFWVSHGTQAQGQMMDRLLHAWTQGYAATLNRAFQRLRRSLKPATRRAMRAAHCRDGAVAHWLNEGGPARAAALVAQPYLLPLALRIGGQWPVAIPEAHRAQMASVLDLGATLTHQIDEGRPHEDTLLALLALPEGEGRLLTWPGHAAWEDQSHPERRSLITRKDLQAIADLNRTVPFQRIFDADRPGLYALTQDALPVLQNLPPGQLPRTAHGFRSLFEFTRNLTGQLSFHPGGVAVSAWQEDHLVGFLEGLDLDKAPDSPYLWWSDIWAINQRLGHRQMSTPWTAEMFARLSFREWEQLAREHILESHPESGEDLRWRPGLLAQAVRIGPVIVTEVNSTHALKEAVTRQGTGQPWWANEAAEGKIRVFELTDPEGQPQGLARVVHHRTRLCQWLGGPQGNAPSAQAEAAMTAVLSIDDLWWRAPFIPSKAVPHWLDSIKFDKAFSAAFRLKHPPRPDEPTAEDLRQRPGLFVCSKVIG